MKSLDFAKMLKSYAAIFALSGTSSATQQLNTLATVFEQSPASTVSSVLKRLQAVSTEAASDTPTLGELARMLGPLDGLLASAGKAVALTDLRAVTQSLTSRPSLRLGALLGHASAAPTRKRASTSTTAVRPEVVNEYANRLKEALGNEQRFEPIYRELSVQDRLNVAELKLLARHFSHGASRSKAEALRKIWSPHQSLLGFRAKDLAIGGRTAA